MSQHFIAVSETGTSHPVIIQNALISGKQIELGDEIAVFDDSLCTGTTAFQGSFPITIAAWMEVSLPDNTVLPGAIIGHPMFYKIWQQKSCTELDAAPAYSQGTGSFGEKLTVLSSLTAEKYKKPQRFTSIDSTGDARPIIIQDALIDSQSIAIGDEIAVFDDTLCTGAVVFQGIFPVTITAWMEVPIPDGTFLPGAKANHAMNFKIWQNQNDTVLDAIPEYSVGTGTFGETLTVTSLNVTIDTYVSSKSLPDQFILEQNYPNPFNSETTIRLNIKNRIPVVLKIYDMLGQEILTLTDKEYNQGSYEIIFNADMLSSGLYFYKIYMGTYCQTKKMVLLK